MNDGESVLEYFSDNALQWGGHYHGGSLTLGFFVGVFRRGLKQRWETTIKHAMSANGKSFLDVGRGTSVYCTTLAKAAATKVTGIDFASGMIGLACRTAKEERVA